MRLARVALSSALGAAAGLATAGAVILVLAFLVPGCPCAEMLRGAVTAARGGEQAFIRHALEPGAEAEFVACLSVEDVTALPLGVLVGALVSGALASPSLVPTAIGALAPALFLLLVAPGSSMMTPMRAGRAIVVAVAAWGLAVAWLWLGRRRAAASDRPRDRGAAPGADV